MALLTAFVLGPLVTTATLGDYFSSWETWIYPVRITLMFPFGAQLPGVYDDNVFAGAVNGSLWSLPVEVFAYLTLAVLGIAGLLRRRRLVLGLAVLGLLWAGVWVTIAPPAIASTFVLAAFAVGCAAYLYRDRLVLSWPVGATLLALCILSSSGPTAPRVIIWTVSAVYLSLCFAYALPPIGRFVTRFGDASYGVYIWAFPVQQTIYQVLGPDLGPWTMIAIATPVVWILAQISWHLLEAPALRHKPRRPDAAPALPLAPGERPVTADPGARPPS